jgi:hypothetical protein
MSKKPDRDAVSSPTDVLSIIEARCSARAQQASDALLLGYRTTYIMHSGALEAMQDLLNELRMGKKV